GVESGLVLLVKAARLGKIETAQQLANKENVGAFHPRSLQWGAISNRGERHGRPQIREAAQSRAQGQKARFGLLLRRQMVKLRRAHGSQEDRIALAAGFQRAFGKRRAMGANGRAAHGLLLADKLAVRKLTQGPENPNGFTRHFRANTITGEHCQLEKHGFVTKFFLAECCQPSLRQRRWTAPGPTGEPGRAGPGRRSSSCSPPVS